MAEREQAHRFDKTLDLRVISAVESRQGQMLIALLESGADPNASDAAGITALMRAAARGFTDMGEILLRHGADINKANRFGFTALMTATVKGQNNMARFLIERDADMDLQDKSTGWTALHYAASDVATDLVVLMLESGANPLVPDNYGDTVLDTARVLFPTPVGLLVILQGAEDAKREELAALIELRHGLDKNLRKEKPIRFKR